MPVNVKVIHAREFIKASAKGTLDFAETKQALLDVASLIKQPESFEVLLDTRAADIEMSIIEVFELGEALAAHPSLRRSKIGLLTPKSKMDNGLFLETVASNRGANIRAFTDFEQAMTWLVLREQDV